MTTSAPAPVLRAEGLSKSFGAARVLRDISLEVAGGEFVGLVGPNGAGKSTLIKILDGLYRASSGRITLGGQVVQDLGDRPEVAFIHQDLGLVDSLSIADNLRLGQPAIRLAGPVLDRPAEREAAARAMALVSLEVDVRAPVGGLSPGEKTLVAIARAFARGARILFVDEATSTLTGPDAQRVIDTLAASAASGATVVMVSHRLSEILDATARVILLLDGRVAADRPTAGLGRRDLVALLASHEREKTADIGESVAAEVIEDPVRDRPAVLTLEGACANGVGPMDLTVRAGEVVGLTGTPGSGLHDIGFVVHGSARLTAGRRTLAPGATTALVPPHRESQGGFGTLDVRTNLTISSMKRWRAWGGVMARRREQRDAIEMIDRLDVQPRDLDAMFGVLSGGNKQKVIFGRALLRQAQLYVLCEPTRGVDIDARMEIYRLIESLPDETTGVLVVSSDPEDLFAVCGRVAVVSDGAPGEFHAVNALTEEDLEALL